jgi:hypothetical protein
VFLALDREIMRRDINSLALGFFLAALFVGLILLVIRVPLLTELAQATMIVAGMVLVASFSSISRYLDGESSAPLIHITFNEARVRQVLDSVVSTEYESARGREIPEGKVWEPTAETLMVQDPVLALAKLRIDLERELRRIAFEYDVFIEPRRMSIGSMLKALAERDILDRNVVAAIRDVLPACNLAIHGGDVTPQLASGVINIGEELLRILETVRFSRTVSSI